MALKKPKNKNKNTGAKGSGGGRTQNLRDAREPQETIAGGLHSTRATALGDRSNLRGADEDLHFGTKKRRAGRPTDKASDKASIDLSATSEEEEEDVPLGQVSQDQSDNEDEEEDLTEQPSGDDDEEEDLTEQPAISQASGDDNDDDDELPGASKDVEATERESNAEASTAMTDKHTFSDGYARTVLRLSALENQTMVFDFVVNEVFQDMKFTEGDEEQEMDLVRLAIDTEYVKVGDPKIAESSFVLEYFSHIPKSITNLRQRTVSASRKKFQRDLRIDVNNKALRKKEAPILPPNLGSVLMSSTYRKYLDTDGNVIEGRESDYEVYKWFVKNVLSCVNFELTGRLSKKVREVGYLDFISKIYSVSDEAFAVLIVLNYENRWRNQVIHPPKDKKLLATHPLYACKWTSSQKGYCKLPWKSEGIDKYNELVEKIGKLRADPTSGIKLESQLKEEFEGVKPLRKRKRAEVIESRPKMGGALQRKLAALKNNK